MDAIVAKLSKRLARSRRGDTAARIDNVDRRMTETHATFSITLQHQVAGLQTMLDRRLHDSSQRLDARLDVASRSYADVKASLEEVKQSSQRILRWARK